MSPAHLYSESELLAQARDLAAMLRPGERVLLEGPLGAGKTTFARELLTALGVRQLPEGSPTFAIVHEYASSSTPVIHMDLYRLRSEVELEEAGLPSYFWERKAIVIAEWATLWPAFRADVIRSGKTWEVEIGMDEDSLKRSVVIRSLS